LTKQKLANQKIYINCAGKDFNYDCGTFQRFVKVKGIYIDGELEYYLIKFTTLMRNDPKKYKINKWFADEIFFSEEAKKLTNK